MGSLITPAVQPHAGSQPRDGWLLSLSLLPRKADTTPRATTPRRPPAQTALTEAPADTPSRGRALTGRDTELGAAEHSLRARAYRAQKRDLPDSHVYPIPVSANQKASWTPATAQQLGSSTLRRHNGGTRKQQSDPESPAPNRAALPETPLS